MLGAFMKLKETYDKIKWEAIWNMLKVYGVDGRLPDGMGALYKDVHACVDMKELGESFRIHRGYEIRMCHLDHSIYSCMEFWKI